MTSRARIEQIGENVLQLNEDTVYTARLRLQQDHLIGAQSGSSENNRRAKFYSITAKGRKQLARETENSTRISGLIGRLLQLREKPHSHASPQDVFRSPDRIA